MGKKLRTVQETPESWVRFLDWEDPLEEAMAMATPVFCLENPMDRGAWWATVYNRGAWWATVYNRGAWWATVYRSQRVGH